MPTSSRHQPRADQTRTGTAHPGAEQDAAAAVTTDGKTFAELATDSARQGNLGKASVRELPKHKDKTATSAADGVFTFLGLVPDARPVLPGSSLPAEAVGAAAMVDDAAIGPRDTVQVGAADLALLQLTATPDTSDALPPQPLNPPLASPAIEPTGVASAAGASRTLVGPAGPAHVPVALTDLPAAIASRFVEGAQRFDIRLDPSELGVVEVRLTIDHEGAVNAQMIVERPSTLHHLMRDAPRLEQALADSGHRPSGGIGFSLREDGRRAPQHPSTPNTRDDFASADLANVCVATPRMRASARLDLTV